MLPVRLQVRNFLCYGEDTPPLLFDGFRLACLSGENGHGKSALLDAMTWVLWGQARAKSDDDLIRHGQPEMEVELEFLVGDERYRVIRKRMRPKRERGSGTTILELHHWEGGQFRPITGDTVRETENRIVQILGMQYETFVNSAFLRQGRADEFTVKPPGERKRVLADILGLAYYDDLERRARDQVKAIEQRLRELEAQISEYDRELSERPRYEEEERTTRAAVEQAEARVQQHQQTLDLLRSQKRALDVQAQRLADLQAHHRRLEGDLRQQEALVAEREARVRRLQTVVDQAETIAAGYQRLLAARAELERFDGALAKIRRLEARKHEITRQIESSRAQLRTQLAMVEDAAKRSRQAAAELPGLQQAVQKASTAIGEVEEREQLLVRRREQLDRLNEETGRLAAEQDRLKREMEELKEKLDLLKADAARCPLCDTALGHEGHQRIRERYQQEGKRRGDEWRANAARLKQIGEERALLERELRSAEAEARSLRDQVSSQLARAQQALVDAERLAGELPEHERAIARLQQQLEGDGHMAELTTELREIEESIAVLRYDDAEHQAVRQSVREYERFEPLHRQLEEAQASIDGERAAYEQAAARLTALREERQQEQQRIAELEQEVVARDEIARQVAAQERELDALSRELAQLRTRHGAALQRVENCNRLESLRQERVAAQTAAAEERSIYEELALAFGKKGVQALLIEAALPELTEEANLLLGRMTDNRMALSIETQRDTKKGETVETLDIKIGDELGTRPYELFSGGEAFRVNLAVRIALSKLLARRAGAQLRMLVVDEGFGTQDAAGREKLVDAINAVQDEFDRILVITHIDELKDHFPVRIEVTKRPTGSTFVIS